MNPAYLIPGTRYEDPPWWYSTKKSLGSPFCELEQELYRLIVNSHQNGSPLTIYKFGDGDYYFLKRKHVGSAKPGNRALSKPLSRREIGEFRRCANNADIYLCEIDGSNRRKFKRALNGRRPDYPAELIYGLVASRRLFGVPNARFGLIGAREKLELISELIEKEEYQEYLGVTKFTDYICIPQRFSCDDLLQRRLELRDQLRRSSSSVFLVGIGHLKSGVLSEFPSYKSALYVDIGSGIDGLAGVIDTKRPYFGDWINFQIGNLEKYRTIDYLNFNFQNIKRI
jgi:hypothetical protein